MAASGEGVSARPCEPRQPAAGSRSPRDGRWSMVGSRGPAACPRPESSECPSRGVCRRARCGTRTLRHRSPGGGDAGTTSQTRVWPGGRGGRAQGRARSRTPRVSRGDARLQVGCGDTALSKRPSSVHFLCPGDPAPYTGELKSSPGVEGGEPGPGREGTGGREAKAGRRLLLAGACLGSWARGSLFRLLGVRFMVTQVVSAVGVSPAQEQRRDLPEVVQVEHGLAGALPSK